MSTDKQYADNTRGQINVPNSLVVAATATIPAYVEQVQASAAATPVVLTLAPRPAGGIVVVKVGSLGSTTLAVVVSGVSISMTAGTSRTFISNGASYDQIFPASNMVMLGGQDSCTVTIDTVVADNTVVVNGVTKTWKASGTTAHTCLLGDDDDAAAANMAVEISKIANVAATSAEKVITITAAVGHVLIVTGTATRTTVAYVPAVTSIYGRIRTAT